MTFSDNLSHIIRQRENLASYTWLGLGGEAKYFAEPGNVTELASLIAQAGAAGMTVRFLGSGSNILIREEGFDGLVIHLATADLCSITIEGDRLTARAGAKLNHVISAAVGAGLGGLEHLAGIPGTIGAAIAGNAGITNDDIGSRVSSVAVIGRDGAIVNRGGSQLQFGFRRSNLMDSFIVEAEFKLRPGNAAELTRRMQKNWIVRRAAQPNMGSRAVQAFIEPDGTRLQDVLEESAVRDAREGDFCMDSLHPGFVVATGQPKSKDLIALIARVNRSVEAKTGIQLQSPLKIW
jgi:UDP-N-acetylmuramate dehydrogenase